uniref:Uncharacterized protein n=1 Tax=Chromera velia CCMP2878 TaxID=1169474 RepID=A0A0G4GSA4_9ALVE|eukprot:Cvel_23098.t1-p1 / transcript=Cvel_23098.t1 / gene=Cvel_23098 / organism=Chromera_velia_CCMP2878 / gene_product=hypothetical protein / transcript_product=hypothetical protein / location=Cvel_scaffold2343:14256-16210(+) / protein_length=513 / sequence_SO=supercontig / SO=protein_coding / is_pseudo=false
MKRHTTSAKTDALTMVPPQQGYSQFRRASEGGHSGVIPVGTPSVPSIPSHVTAQEQEQQPIHVRVGERASTASLRSHSRGRKSRPHSAKNSLAEPPAGFEPSMPPQPPPHTHHQARHTVALAAALVPEEEARRHSAVPASPARSGLLQTGLYGEAEEDQIRSRSPSPVPSQRQSAYGEIHGGPPMGQLAYAPAQGFGPPIPPEEQMGVYGDPRQVGGDGDRAWEAREAVLEARKAILSKAIENCRLSSEVLIKESDPTTNNSRDQRTSAARAVDPSPPRSRSPSSRRASRVSSGGSGSLRREKSKKSVALAVLPPEEAMQTSWEGPPPSRGFAPRLDTGERPVANFRATLHTIEQPHNQLLSADPRVASQQRMGGRHTLAEPLVQGPASLLRSRSGSPDEAKTVSFGSFARRQSQEKSTAVTAARRQPSTNPYSPPQGQRYTHASIPQQEQTRPGNVQGRTSAPSLGQQIYSQGGTFGVAGRSDLSRGSMFSSTGKPRISPMEFSPGRKGTLG